MRTLATKQSTNDSAKQQKGDRGRSACSSASRSRSVSPLSTGIPLLQRKCACGGGCPRCQAEQDLEKALPIQTKLKISQPGDKYEQEADRVAEEVVRRIHNPQPETLQRQPFLEDEDEQLHRKSTVQSPISSLHPVSARDSLTVSPNLETAIQHARNGGQTLPEQVREPMEQVFGADFSRVRVHKDSRSERLNQSLQASAFTIGYDIFLGTRTCDPGSKEGKRLLAHELAHVLQQNNKVLQQGRNNESLHHNSSFSPFVRNSVEEASVQREVSPDYERYLLTISDEIGLQRELERIEGEFQDVELNSDRFYNLMDEQRAVWGRLNDLREEETLSNIEEIESNIELLQAIWLAAFEGWWAEQNTNTLLEKLRAYALFHRYVTETDCDARFLSILSHEGFLDTERLNAISLRLGPALSLELRRGAFAQFCQDRETEIISRLTANPIANAELWQRFVEVNSDNRSSALIAFRNRVGQQLVSAYAQQVADRAVAGQSDMTAEEIQGFANNRVLPIVRDYKQKFSNTTSDGVHEWQMPSQVSSIQLSDLLSIIGLIASSIGSIITIAVSAVSVLATAGLALLVVGMGLGIYRILTVEAAEEQEEVSALQIERTLKDTTLTGYEAIGEGIEDQENLIALLCTSEALEERFDLNNIDDSALRNFVWQKMFPELPEDGTEGRHFVRDKMHRELDHHFDPV